METYIIMFIESQWYSLNVRDFDDYKNSITHHHTNTLITFQTSDLIRHLKSQNLHKLPLIIDIESFDKQMSQEGKEFREDPNWKAIYFLKYHKRIDSDFELKEGNFKVFLEHFAVIYQQLLSKDIDEKNRFETIEIKINNLIFERQSKGIKIDSSIAKQKCIELEKSIYSIKNTLQFQYNIFTPDEEKAQSD